MPAIHGTSEFRNSWRNKQKAFSPGGRLCNIVVHVPPGFIVLSPFQDTLVWTVCKLNNQGSTGGDRYQGDVLSIKKLLWHQKQLFYDQRKTQSLEGKKGREGRNTERNWRKEGNEDGIEGNEKDRKSKMNKKEKHSGAKHSFHSIPHIPSIRNELFFLLCRPRRMQSNY